MAQILSELGIEGYTAGVPAAVEALADFRGTVRNRAKSGLASSSEPRDALIGILLAVNRCPTSPTNAQSCYCASCDWADDEDSVLAWCNLVSTPCVHCQHAAQGCRAS